MASITSLSNSSYNTSSIYGTRNVLSGLASGMDTETMIENAVSGIKLKIQNLQKKRTKVEWQQEAYRNIIDKAVNFNNKYTSYTSKTNLLSQSFFNNAVTTATNGTYKDKISASGKTSSDIQINAVKQMATAASYTVSGLAGMSSGEIAGITGKEFDIAAQIPVSTVSGTLTFQYGGQNGTSFDISFGELEDLNEMEGNNAGEKLANAINKKLSEITYNYTKNGFSESTTADKAIKVDVDPFGRITFSDGLGNGNSVKVSSSTGKIKSFAGENVITSPNTLTQDMRTSDYISNKELGLTFNGSTKKISMSEVLDRAGAYDSNDGFVKALNEELAEAFGTGKITASYEGGKLSLTPSNKGDTMSVGGSAVEALGFSSGDSNFVNTGKKLSDILGDKAGTVFSQANRLAGAGGATKNTSPGGSVYYLDSKGNRVDEDGYRVDNDGKALYDFQINGAHINVTEDTTLESLINSVNSNPDAGVKISYSKLTNEFKFTATQTGSNGKIEFGKLGSALFGDTGSAMVKPMDKDAKVSSVLGSDYDGFGNNKFTINLGSGSDATPFSVNITKDSTIDSIVSDLNDMISVVGDLDNESFKGVEVSFDSATNSLVFQKDGKNLDFSYGSGAAQDLFSKIQAPAGASYTSGQDAVMDVTINGRRFEDLTRSSNSFDLDGLTVNVKGTFDAVGKDGNAYEPITFTTTTDTDKIVDAIRSFVDDYNEMATELKNAYSTLPAQRSNGAKYEPLTAEEEDSYSESELKAYNEKAKQGILFGDTTLSSMYSKLLSAITPGGADGQTLREIGIGTSYNSGMTTLSLDEDKLRAALESDPDKVRTAFTKTTEGGSSTNGLMQTLQNTLNTYVKTTGEPKGVLIARAGSIKAPTSLNSNSLKTQMDNIDSQIERWQNKMSDQIDRYTTKFSKLEQLIAQMNSQASALSGLMGGTEGY